MKEAHIAAIQETRNMFTFFLQRNHAQGASISWKHISYITIPSQIRKEEAQQ